MKVEIIDTIGSWRAVADAARTTVHKEPGTGEPSSIWKRKMLKAEHSPIRQLMIRWRWTDLPYWVSVHLVRHKFGIEHFVSTQRTDRTGFPRDMLPQGALVTHECIANAQAIINISRKRLCHKASKETQQAWALFTDALYDFGQEELADACVPECIYRGHCPELCSCGYVKSNLFPKFLEDYQTQNGKLTQ